MWSFETFKHEVRKLKKVRQVLEGFWKKYGIKCYVFYEGKGIVTQVVEEKSLKVGKQLDVGVKSLSESRFLFYATCKLSDILKRGARVTVANWRYDVLDCEVMHFGGEPLYLSALCRREGCL